MAKRKHAAALFEVIHQDKRFGNRHGGSGGGAGWSWPRAKWWRRDSGGPRKQRNERSGPSLLERLFNHLPPLPRIGLEADPERQEVRFRLSYTAAVVSVFTVVVAVALSFMMGRHGAHPATPALADRTTEELRAGPAHPQVLDVHAANGVASSGENSAPMVMASDTVPASAQQQQPPANQKNSSPAPQQQQQQQGMRPSHWSEPRGPSTLVVGDSTRTVGMQYVVIQSYPPKEADSAKAVVDLLNSNGVLCTMETNIPYTVDPKWICVVGIHGFTRIRNSPEYDAYIARIKEVEAQAGGSSKFLKKLDPKPYTWKDAKAKAD
jgi:hypothetical protein